MQKVYGYVRKSPDDKEDTESSISNQIKLIEKTCKEKEWFLVKIFQDKNVTGSDRYRKEFTEMMTEIFSSPINIIIVKDQDRFCRDSSFFKDTLQDLDVREKRVYSIMKHGFLSHEDLGDNVKALFDSQYIIEQRKKADVFFNQKKEDGLPPIPAPFGYKNKNKNWVADKKKAKIIIEVLQDYVDKVNLKETIKRLKINKSLRFRIIKNAQKGLYSGFVVYERKYKDSNKKIVRVEEVKYKGKHQNLISEELFNSVNSN